jgi:hypothetical protein
MLPVGLKADLPMLPVGLKADLPMLPVGLKADLPIKSRRWQVGLVGRASARHPHSASA